MRSYIKNIGNVVLLVLMLSVFVGCQTAVIPVDIRLPGELNLSGVSKLALVDFNSLSTDGDRGIFAADAETLSVVQGKVASVFAANKTYSLVRLDVEKVILDDYALGRVSPKTRFDGLVYGRVWWEVSPELCDTYPTVMNLTHWDNVKYMGRNLLGQWVPMVARVTTHTEDVLETLSFRSWNANLMLALTVYKLSSDGTVEKLTETYAIASRKFLINNGQVTGIHSSIGLDQESMEDALRAQASSNSRSTLVLDSVSSGGGASSSAGNFKLLQRTNTFPTELQVKYQLANQLTAELARKLMPTVTRFEIERSFGDVKMYHLLRNHAYAAGISYADACLSKNGSDAVLREMQSLLEIGESGNKSLSMALSEVSVSEEARSYIESNSDYFFGKALCYEASGNFAEALYRYRFLFHFVPTRESANGISRCLFALNMDKQVRHVAKNVRRASRKARLD